MGTIVAIHRPHGGIIACDDTEEKYFFTKNAMLDIKKH